jgi:hypothetical protein
MFYHLENNNTGTNFIGSRMKEIKGSDEEWNG